jgi:hypothetical protein
MFFENKRQLLFVLTWLITIWSCAFFAGLAWGSPNQNCTYVTNISYDNSGQIVNAKQTYECKTPQPNVVEKIVYTDLPGSENISNKTYNEENPVTAMDVITGLYILGSIFVNSN